ncbi:MAG: CoA-binding protein [Gemmatimonadetes bacterium]|nr:CoA-binding protein [Gemmatimonadota bacterium]
MLITDDPGLRRILTDARRIAVLGIKPETRSQTPAHYVPLYLAQAGYEIIPVPVYYPEVAEILGQPVFRRLADIPGRIDVVQVFRKPEDIPAHLDDLLAARPVTVWLQSGIRHEAVETALAAASIDVVHDRCMMVEHERLLGES